MARKPIISGAKLQNIVASVLDRLGATDSKLFLIKKVAVASPRDKAMQQKPKIKDVLYEVTPLPATFQVSLKETMDERGIIVTGDFKAVVSANFGYEKDVDDNIIPYDWQEGDIVLFREVKWRVYMVKKPTLDLTHITYILYIRKEPGEGYTPADS
jgi:hypothetical protein